MMMMMIQRGAENSGRFGVFINSFMSLMMMIPMLVPVFRKVWKWVLRFINHYNRSDRFICVRTLQSMYVHHANGTCESYVSPRIFRAVMLAIRERFTSQDNDERRNAYSLVDLITEGTTEEMILLNRSNDMDTIKVEDGIFVRSWKDETERETPPITRTSVSIEIIIDTARFGMGKSVFTIVAQFLEKCEERLNEVEGDELNKPHIMSMIKGDIVTHGTNKQKPLRDEDDESCCSGADDDIEESVNTAQRGCSSNRKSQALVAKPRLLRFETKAIMDHVVDNPSFPEKKELIQSIRNFRNNKQLYKTRGLRHNYSIILKGYPGCGKSRFITDVAVEFSLVVIHVSPDMVRTPESVRALFLSDFIGGYSVPHNRRLYVIEDVDCSAWAKVLLNRFKYGNCESSDIFSLDLYLQIIDGMIPREGQMIIYTTNGDVRMFDPAFLRSGRVDKIVEINRMNADDIALLYEKWFDEVLPKDVKSVLRDGVLSIAEVVSVYRCFDKPLVWSLLKEKFASKADQSQQHDQNQNQYPKQSSKKLLQDAAVQVPMNPNIMQYERKKPKAFSNTPALSRGKA